MKIKDIPWLLVTIAAVTVPLCLHLGKMPIQLWDEARIAVSAQELLKNSNLLVVHFNGTPDMWSVKPPLMIWLQALSMWTFGMHEWTTRLPGALASICTCIVVFLFFSRRKSPLQGFIAATVLVTSQGFMTLHCSRTGDYDALLTLLTTLYCLNYYLYIEKNNARHLYLTFLWLTQAAFTKGVAGLLFLPALFLFTVYKKRLLSLVTNKHFYIGAIVFVIFIGGYYLLREHYNPSYLNAVQENELGGRYTKALEHNRGVFLYYFNNMVRYHFKFWYLLLLPGVAIGLFIDNKQYRDMTIYLVLLLTTFFLVISSAQTKLYWYAMPMYPFMAILASFVIYALLVFLQKKLCVPFPLCCLLLPLLFFIPYKDVLEVSNAAPNLGKEGWKNEHMAEYLQLKLHEKSCKPIIVRYTGYQANLLWYTNALAHKQGMQKNKTQDEDGTKFTVAVFQDSVKKYMETHYQTTILQTYYNVTVYSINGTRQ